VQHDFVREKNHTEINIPDNNYLIMQIVHYEINIHMDTNQTQEMKYLIRISICFTLVSAFC